MTPDHIELYRPRQATQMKIWRAGPLRFKIYGLCAQGQTLSPIVIDDARRFVTCEVPPIAAEEGASNDLGFVIIHAGDLGVSISAHWWIQGSVLCQHLTRRLWHAHAPMDTAKRPVVACVWELELINAEKDIWQKTMMSGTPDPDSYLNSYAEFASASLASSGTSDANGQ